MPFLIDGQLYVQRQKHGFEWNRFVRKQRMPVGNGGDDRIVPSLLEARMALP